MAYQDSIAVAITGGSITGITDLTVADGGTGASNATDARTNLGVTASGADTTYAFRANNLSDLASAITSRTNLGLGTIATQDANAVAITGGDINSTPIGSTTPSTGEFTTLGATGTSTLAAVNSGALAVTGAITSTTDATLSGLTVGKGAGAISTNTASGFQALYNNTTGNYNTASGFQALFDNTTGSSNTASGTSALYNNTTGNYNTASGASALYNNTTGNSNTANGYFALTNNTTGSGNTASGANALRDNTSGATNTASGASALQRNTTGSSNTASGVNALYYNTTGTQNTASGYAALNNNTTGNLNTASGVNALQRNTTGTSNTANGTSALRFNTTGSYNTASGLNALYNNTTGSGNTAINPLNSAGTYAPVFNPTTENNRFCMGSTGVTNAYIQVAWTVVSDARDKTNFAPVPHGLEFVKALQPTAYQFRTARDSEETNGGVRYGFKAQDVLALEGANPVIVDNEDADKLRMIDTALIPVLVKALQELNAKFDAYVLTHP